ncbi:c6 transcription factor [Gigaspora margarita]|uniref:C6 transcription factor n=1 Tax=Gigaspora margarita TaxID=4874 RepID=A0A8H3X5H1_GIGMA|nr:c6 transcription factor [Gigaspora margarita]
MTVTRPGNPARYPAQTDLLRRTNSSHSPQTNNAKRSRGPINKRACQRCRQGKIKCDGDAETGKACSNCDPDLCKYDNSPRKNKQVENLKQRLQKVEEQLLIIYKSYNDKLESTYIEKETLCLLYENKGRFTDTSIFQGLIEAIKQCHLDRQLLSLTYSLLQRIATHEDKIPEIITSLQRVLYAAADRAKNHHLSIPTTNTHIEQQPYDTSIMSGSVDPTMVLANNPSNLSTISSFDNSMCHNCETNGLNQIHASSSDDDGSESFSGGFDCNDEGSGGPSTPNEQSHPNCYESKPPFQSSNGSHQLPGSSQILEVSDYYQYSFSGIAPAEFSSYFFLDHSTTSPTDENNMFLKLNEC